MLAHYDVLVRGARVLDPSQGIDRVIDLAISGDRIAGTGDFSAATAGRVIDGAGKIASPGWIDLHVHVYKGSGTYGVNADREAGVDTGVTTVVDAGSAGAETWEGFKEYVIDRSTTRVLGFLNISLMRGPGPWHGDWRNFNQNLTIETARRAIANGDCVGIKILASQRHVGNLGIIPLKLAHQAARYANTRLMVHLGNPPPLIADVLDMLDSGDIVTHCWHGKGQGLLGPDNQPIPEARAAAARGVKFDLGHGQASFSFATARHAMAAGLPLHSISTDIHGGNLHGPVFNMGTTMAKFLHLGVSLPDVIRMSTSGPASLIGRQDEFGTLRPGTCADVTVFRVVEGDYTFTDSNHQAERATQNLAVDYTIRAGRVVTDKDRDERGV